jgi:hypothetical protein
MLALTKAAPMAVSLVAKNLKRLSATTTESTLLGNSEDTEGASEQNTLRPLLRNCFTLPKSLRIFFACEGQVSTHAPQ